MTTKLILGTLSSLLLAACGSPLVNGWHRDPARATSPAAVCENLGKVLAPNGQCSDKSTAALVEQADTPAKCVEIGGTVWVDRIKACKTYNGLATAADCALAAGQGWVWAANADKVLACIAKEQAACEARGGMVYDATVAAPEARCITRPTIKFADATKQTVSAGSAMTPVAITVTPPGAQAKILSQTCPSATFFQLADNQVTSVAVDAAWSSTDCTVTVAASKGTLQSAPQTLTVSIAQGFLSYCAQVAKAGPQDPRIVHVVGVLQALADSGDCTEANKKLEAATTLDLRGEGLNGKDLQVLAGFTKLEFLYLQQNQIDSVAALQALPNLKLLAMAHTTLAGDPVLRAKPDVCPVSDATNRAVRSFCLIGDLGGDDGPPVQPAPPPAPPTPTPAPTPAIHS